MSTTTTTTPTTPTPSTPTPNDTAPPPPRARRAGRVRETAIRLALLVGGLLCLVPLLWVALSSLKDPEEILRVPLQFFPEDWGNLSNYAELFGSYDFGRYMLNSFAVTAIGIATSTVIALLAAYAFAFYRFPGKEALFLLVLALFMVPQEALVLPMFLMISEAGLTNTYLGMAFPDLFTVLGVYLLRQFMEGIPFSYLEAARSDGAGEWRILWRIVVPMVGPAIAVFVIIKFLFSWNAFLWPMLVAQEASMYTVTVGLVNFAGSDFNQWNLINAATMISMIPTIILFIVLQRHLVRGVAMSGMK